MDTAIDRAAAAEEIQRLRELVTQKTREAEKAAADMLRLDKQLKMTDELILEFRKAEATMQDELRETERQRDEAQDLAEEAERDRTKAVSELDRERRQAIKLRDDNEELLRQVCELIAQLEAAQDGEAAARKELDAMMRKHTALKIWVLEKLHPELQELIF